MSDPRATAYPHVSDKAARYKRLPEEFVMAMLSKIGLPSVSSVASVTDEHFQAVENYLKPRDASEAVSERKTITINRSAKISNMGDAKVIVRSRVVIDLDQKKAEERRLLDLERKVAEAKAALVLDVKPKEPVEQLPAPSKVKEAPKPAEKSSVPAKKIEKVLPEKITYLSKKDKTASEEEARLARLGMFQPRRSHHKEPQQAFTRPSEKIIYTVKILESNSIQDLASKMAMKSSEVIKALMKMGVMATINYVIDQDTAQLLVEELGHKVDVVSSDALEESLMKATQGSGKTKSRPPVVTIMGHVNHGKTSLLDRIRTTNVTAGEAGGITQHIGAYHVETPRGVITFLDTPGHENFSAMRARGAKLTDIIILVVAADDGVMPQTIEAIKHAKSANVPLIVAVNKSDLPGVDLSRIKTELSQQEVNAEDWGGDVMFVPVSAKTGLGIDELLEKILLQAEVMELKAEQDCSARGVVIEARLDKGRGIVASLLIQAGYLKKGDMVLAGCVYGRVKSLMDENRLLIAEAGPSIPVEILGLSEIPEAGDDFMVLPTETMARQAARDRYIKSREVKLAREQHSHEALFHKLGSGEQLNVVVKGDVQGSVEALVSTLVQKKVMRDEKPITVNVVHAGVGDVTENDVKLAAASNGLILAFSVKVSEHAKDAIKNKGVALPISSHIIYELESAVHKALLHLAGPIRKEEVLGVAQVLQIFPASKGAPIAGSKVLKGVIKRGVLVHVMRDNKSVLESTVGSIRRVKDEVTEVREGFDCGLGVNDYFDVQVGDQIIAYEVMFSPRTE